MSDKRQSEALEKAFDGYRMPHVETHVGHGDKATEGASERVSFATRLHAPSAWPCSGKSRRIQLCLGRGELSMVVRSASVSFRSMNWNTRARHISTGQESTLVRRDRWANNRDATPRSIRTRRGRAEPFVPMHLRRRAGSRIPRLDRAANRIQQKTRRAGTPSSEEALPTARP
jgi:hypothetical protein